MFKILKKYLIPHAENNHTPHILRNASITFFLGIVLISETVYLSDALFIIPHFSGTSAVILSTVIEDTNNNRVSDNLPILLPNSLLNAAAQAKAIDMASKGYFSHNSPDGKTPWYWLSNTQYPYIYAGENLAVNFYDSKDVVDAWMNSPLHRENILNTHYSDIGVGTAEGTYQGSHALFIVQFFGSTANGAVSSSASSSLIINTQQASVISATRSVVFTYPKQIINILYFLIFLLISISIILSLSVKIRTTHPKLIFTAILLLIVLIILTLFNKEILSLFGSIG